VSKFWQRRNFWLVILGLGAVGIIIAGVTLG